MQAHLVGRNNIGEGERSACDDIWQHERRRTSKRVTGNECHDEVWCNETRHHGNTDDRTRDTKCGSEQWERRTSRRKTGRRLRHYERRYE